MLPSSDGGDRPSDYLSGPDVRAILIHPAQLDKAVGFVPAEPPGSQRTNALFIGTHAVSGTATAVVVLTSAATEFGQVSQGLKLKSPETEFVDEVPYDFIRKRLSVMVGQRGSLLMVTQGALQNVLEAGSTAELGSGEVVPLNPPRKKQVFT